MANNAPNLGWIGIFVKVTWAIFIALAVFDVYMVASIISRRIP